MIEKKSLPKPIPPEEWECCGGECGDACVWELYYREKKLYDEQRLFKLQEEIQDQTHEH